MKLSEIIEAWEEGKDIQQAPDLASSGKWLDMPVDKATFRTDKEYRIAPTPNYRPWKPEEVPPVGTAFRSIKNPDVIRLLSAKDSNVCILKSCSWTPEELLGQWEYSIDKEKNWHRCGIEES